MIINIVLADDHAVVRGSIRALLQFEHDMNVVGEASNGNEAVRAVRKLNPDIVIMDIAMSELNGIEATRRIRKTCGLTRVIILSVYNTIEYIIDGLQAGADGYVLKESAGKELVGAIRAVKNGERYLGRGIEEKITSPYRFK